MAKVIHLPELPPPLSALYNNNARAGRIKSRRYKAWIDLCALSVRRPAEPIRGEVKVTYLLRRETNVRQDLFNREKAISDFLTDMGFIEDDCKIILGTLAWDSTIPAAVEIHIYPAQ